MIDYYDLPDTQGFLVSTKACICRDKKLLLLKNSPEYKLNGKDWVFPGGLIEYGERPTETLIREVLEETGLVVKEAQVFYSDSSLIDFIFKGDQQKKIELVNLFFKTLVEAGNVKLSSEHSDAGWFFEEEILNLDTADTLKHAVEIYYKNITNG